MTIYEQFHRQLIKFSKEGSKVNKIKKNGATLKSLSRVQVLIERGTASLLKQNVELETGGKK